MKNSDPSPDRSPSANNQIFLRVKRMVTTRNGTAFLIAILFLLGFLSSQRTTPAPRSLMQHMENTPATITGGIVPVMADDLADGSASVPYQGQNTGRFQLYYSAHVRADTFLLDSEAGIIYQETSDSNGDTEFQPVAVNPSPVPGTSPGRYRIYYPPLVRADTFMLDTTTGRMWQSTTIGFQEIHGPASTVPAAPATSPSPTATPSTVPG